MSEDRPPTVGILGAGALGSNIARGLSARGIRTTISNSRGPQSLAPLVEELGPSVTAVTTAEAARADIVVLAVRWVDAPSVLGSLPRWGGRILIDGTNAVEFLAPGSPGTMDPDNPLAGYGLKVVDLNGELSSRVISGLAPGSKVVRAFQHLDISLLSDPETPHGRRVLFYSGDDSEARASVGRLIERMGFHGVDLGGLDVGAHLTQVPTGSLARTEFFAR
ncbi:NADP oxidoreductase [Rhodococcus sp. 06-462-5]|uniref:NADPH-dependent F420 reductase n=1 Tax=unclassified Rhodococcus (in: high G+C Gram-positive bacteria) TaxID=192944 RepID=UPI000B9A7762|nr:MULTISPECIES: NAD(P)-binding domain-containing protein [unclassified Rhodococcus (in: high G+C Gram-positive bacteria)]OZC73595.1 NADP oxidoreductase [Rhodococcus sp. 06-462-5]OZE63404.1 NADP oxidoreductase [Rhodococcus sp. 02-925g]